jgi:hypothetical protein
LAEEEMKEPKKNESLFSQEHHCPLGQSPMPMAAVASISTVAFRAHCAKLA